MWYSTYHWARLSVYRSAQPWNHLSAVFPGGFSSASEGLLQIRLWHCGGCNTQFQQFIRLHHSCRFVYLWISNGLIRFQEASCIIEPNLKWMEEATSTLTSVFVWWGASGDIHQHFSWRCMWRHSSHPSMRASRNKSSRKRYSMCSSFQTLTHSITSQRLDTNNHTLLSNQIHNNHRPSINQSINHTY